MAVGPASQSLRAALSAIHHQKKAPAVVRIGPVRMTRRMSSPPSAAEHPARHDHFGGYRRKDILHCHQEGDNKMAELSDKSSDALRHGNISDIGHLLYMGYLQRQSHDSQNLHCDEIRRA